MATPDIISLDIKNNHPVESITSRIGRTGERLAADFLEENSYRLVASNFRVPVGRNRLGATVTGEIDLIAYDRDVLCFVEVKTRSSDEFIAPLAAVDVRKQRQITRTARMYRKIFHLTNQKFRYDVISIVLKNKTEPQIDLIKSFWSESKFSKTNWSDDF